MDDLISKISGISADIRYVAIYRGGRLASWERPSLAAPSSAESDRYEELIVNPTLLTLLSQRGNIDCGGLRFVVVRYGNFFQAIFPLPGGHASVAFEPTANPPDIVFPIRSLLDGLA